MIHTTQNLFGKKVKAETNVIDVDFGGEEGDRTIQAYMLRY